MDMDWQYDSAKDRNLSLVERLKECPREPDPLVYAARVTMAVAIRAALRLYHRFEIIGREHLPRDRAFVLVANHASHLDTVALLAGLPLRLLNCAYPLAARDYFEANRLRFALAAIIANVMLPERDARGRERLKLCQRMLDEDGSILVMFPEGTRSIDGCVGRFRRGIGWLLAGTPYPVVPCYLEGTAKAWPKGAHILRPARVRLVIGEARTYEAVAANDAGVQHICSELRNAVLALASETCPHTVQPNSQEAYS